MKKSSRRTFITRSSVRWPRRSHCGSQEQTRADQPVTKFITAAGCRWPRRRCSTGGSHGNLVFVSGIGAHFEGDIKAHTKRVLDDLQKALELAGSSMEKVLKVNVHFQRPEGP